MKKPEIIDKGLVCETKYVTGLFTSLGNLYILIYQHGRIQNPEVLDEMKSMCDTVVLKTKTMAGMYFCPTPRDVLLALLKLDERNMETKTEVFTYVEEFLCKEPKECL